MHGLLRHPRADLTDDERRILNRLFVHSPQIKDAHDACEALTVIDESPLSTGQGKRQICRWMRQVSNRGIRCFDRFLGTLRTHFTEITYYFVNRQTSGFVEGLNSKLKVLKRRCYGITNLAHLYQRVYSDLNGYARFGAEPI
ncbi:ISL3 family transposase [Thiocapsa imhoffii]|uniref:ISL3 family transposase n=1 Tax=Thiocapsa imhoffii TaxID=382777 RepID=UPI003FCD3069